MKLFFIALCSVLLSKGVLLILLNQYHFQEIKARGELMLCLKETKGELHQFIVSVEKLNWAINHIDKAKYLIFIPGLQGVAVNAEKAKKLIQRYQDFTLGQYLLKLAGLQKRCRLSAHAFMTPYQISPKGFKRQFDGTTQWRRDKWNTHILGQLELAQIEIKSKKINRLNPEINYLYSIKKANVWSRLQSVWVSSHLPSLSTSI